MQKNEFVDVTAEAIATGGEGIAKIGGVTLFVPYLLPGERATVKIVKIKDGIGYAKIEKIYSPAEERVRPKCAVFTRCGGCQLQHLRYRDQLRFKTHVVSEALRKIGGIAFAVSPCIRSENEYAYRNKLQLPIGRRGERNVVGFFAERSHRIVETDTCPIHPQWAEGVIDAVKRFMDKCGLDGYDEETGKGQLRHIVVRELQGNFLVTLVTTEDELKGIDYLLFLLDSVLPSYSFYLNVNKKKTNVILGEEFKLLKGPGFYECLEGGITYEAGVNTFVQVNEDVRGRLYEYAVSLTEKNETVIDCYAGGGLLTALFALKCKRAYGIELVPEASACADAVKIKNHLQGKMFNICGKVEDRIGEVLEQAGEATVVLDPPRSGVDRSVLKELNGRKVQKIVMISCNPATLARDVGILTGSLVENEKGELLKAPVAEGNYELTLVQPFDMFAQTKWCETLVALNRKF